MCYNAADFSRNAALEVFLRGKAKVFWKTFSVTRRTILTLKENFTGELSTSASILVTNHSDGHRISTLTSEIEKVHRIGNGFIKLFYLQREGENH